MRDTIKKHSDFAIEPDENVARCGYCLIRARPIRFGGKPQYGLVATLRTFGGAVPRNRAKRLLRDWIRFNEKWMRDDRDYIFICRRAILDATRTDGRVAMKKALRYLGRLDNTATKDE